MRAHPFHIFTALIFICNLTFPQGRESPSQSSSQCPASGARLGKATDVYVRTQFLPTQRSSHFWCSPALLYLAFKESFPRKVTEVLRSSGTYPRLAGNRSTKGDKPVTNTQEQN